MNLRLVAIGLVLVVAGIVGRLVPAVVTGISIFSALHIAGLGVLLWVAVRGRREHAEWVKARDTGKFVRTIVVILFLLLTFPLAYGLSRELELGRQYRAVRPHLDNPDPTSALTLASYLRPGVIDCAPVRERIIARIVELDYRHREVTGPLADTVRTDADRAVRNAAAVALGKLMLPRDVLVLIRDMSSLDEETRLLVFQALAAATGVDHGPDAAAWRKWFGETCAGAEASDAFDLATLAYRDPGKDEVLRGLALARIRSGEGADRGRLLAILRDTDPALRTAAAKLLAATGDATVARKVADALLRESDETAALAQVASIRALNPAGADRILHRAAESATNDVARNVARSALLGKEDVDPEDPTALTVRMFRKAEDPSERGRLLNDVMRQAGEGEAAKAEVVRIAGDPAETSFHRLRALSAAVDADAMSAEALVGLFGKAPDREFKEALRSELRTRTGKDGKLDPAAWRKILAEAAAEEE